MKRLFSLRVATLVLALGMFVLGAKGPRFWPCSSCRGIGNIFGCLGECVVTVFGDCQCGSGKF